MAKAEVVGEVAMLVVADAGKFASDLQKKVKKAVAKIATSRTFEPLTRALARAGEEAGDAFARGVDRRGRRRAREAGRAASGAFVQGVTGGIRAGISAVTSAVSTVADAAGAAFRTGISLGTSGVSGFAGAISSLASAGPVGIAVGVTALVAGLVALATIGPAAVSTLVAITAALASLVGLMAAVPASIAVLVAAFGPLILAFQGFGDAVGALADGDMDKFNEALKKLSPSARRVARELKAAMPFFSELRKVAQEALFDPLVGSVTNLVKALGPTLTRGVAGVAGSFGLLFQNLAAIAASPQTVVVIDRLFQAVSRIIGVFQGPVGNLFGSIVESIDAALPAVESFFGRIAEGIDAFANFISQSVEDGSFQKFLDQAFTTLSTIWTIIKNIGTVLADVFLDPALQETGLSFFDAVNDALTEMHRFFQSEQGKQFLADLNTLAKEFIQTLRDVGPVIGFLLSQIAAAISSAASLLRLINLISGRGPRTIGRAVGGAAQAGVQGFATGGEVREDGLYRLAEGNRREVVLPMTNPARARQVANETGVTDMLRGMGGDGVALDVTVLLGTREITDIVDVQVAKSNRNQARALADGPRTE